MVIVVGSSSDEEEDHGENHEDDENGAGVDIDREDGETIQITRDCNC